MPSNDFLPFAGGGGANVVTQGSYAALTSLLANGFTSGTATSNQLNKVWRQGTVMAAVLAQFICDESGQNAVDDGTTATLLSNMKIGIASVLERVTSTVAGTANAITATFTVPPLAFKPGVPYSVRAVVANTTATPTFTPNSGVLTAKTITKLNGQALVAGDIAGAGHWLVLSYDATLDGFVLQNPAVTPHAVTADSATSAGSVPYSGLTGGVPTWNQSTTGNAATATVAASANALNAANGYTVAGLSSSGAISGPGTGLTGTAASMTAGAASTDSQHLGVGQTWQNLTGSRSAGTTYTNSTGKPISVNLSILCTSVCAMYVDSIQVGEGGGNASIRGEMTAIVPNGSNYSASGSGLTIEVWSELR